ncbi:MAG: transcriptional regulator [Cellulomonas sp. 73-145]|mgnify:CR=1 FL=1|uniref:helix-turn-helix transcriptional regulator n=1 Tax=Cellulomonas sp. 73-145 TaxID=1895739 RepID=UPI00092CBBDE|nr:helix-turn-helix transcriptional regulator [Cellulomonas sp. 73-145]OJV58018.1 MAG: transcriptional regulator [Cellulomonas sp. 73-145]
MPSDLGTVLRTWRERVAPADVGLPPGFRRRTPGLRRDELALLAGISVDYLTQLEQGRATAPSARVVEALAGALGLGTAERDHLFLSAGLRPPGTGTVSRYVTPGVRRLVDRLSGTPVSVWDATWTMLLANDEWMALLGPLRDETERNLLWRHFVLGVSAVRHGSAADLDRFETALVADLRAAAADRPADRSVDALVSGLRARSERFAQLWDAGVVGRHASERKTVVHPSVGEVVVDCDVLTVPGAGDLRVVLYTADPGSEAAGALALLSTTGPQAL